MLTKEMTPETTAVQAMNVETLYAKLLSGEKLAIVDVRNEDDFARWRVEGRQDLKIVNIPYFNFLEDEDGSLAQVPQGADEILVVCAKEGSSQFIAELLAEHGITSSYLQDGIVSWGNFYDVRNVVEADWGKIVQVARPARGDLSFVIVANGEAAIVDPLRHVAHYDNVIAEAGAKLIQIFDTHAHADHISGGPELAATHGANYYLHPYDAIHPVDMLPATLAYTPIQDKDRFVLGEGEVEVIWFPGHTLGQVNYLFTAPDGVPYLFTGDGVFLRSFGRPDLGGKGEAWTPILHESLFSRLPNRVGNDAWVLPAHFSVLDEAGENGVFTATYGQLKQSNDALRPQPLAEFSAWVLANLPYFPPEYVEIKRVNAGLVNPNEEAASELELGKNICALSGE
jgi:glyoxylase-like metal-dependent hydrolase (beta-lactamase superfamily II)/rhodanese-related sulfurtransferase